MSQLKEIALGELTELSEYATRLEAELRAANERCARAEAKCQTAMDIAASILHRRQIEVAAFRELLTDIKSSGHADERTKRLVDNAHRAMQGS